MSDNELIAEFMGFRYFPYKEEENGYLHGWMKPGTNRRFGELVRKTDKTRQFLCRATKDMHYDTSWNWLMPVVEKIGKLYHEAFPKGNFVELFLAHKDDPDFPVDHHYIDFVSISINTPISEVHAAVVEFIKWYNESKQPIEQ